MNDSSLLLCGEGQSFRQPIGTFRQQIGTGWPYSIPIKTPDLSDPFPSIRDSWVAPLTIPLNTQEKSEPFSVEYGSVCKDKTTGQIMVYDGEAWIHIPQYKPSKEVKDEPKDSSLS